MAKPFLLALAILLASFGAVAAPAPAAASGSLASHWVRPVPGRVVRPFRAPLTRFGRGHLGADFAAPPGTAVRAAGPGRVVFAGAVAGARHVVVSHAGGLRTSYSFLASVRVTAGTRVGAGEVLGTTGGTGERHDGSALHFALRVDGIYVDPMRLFTDPDLAARVHLAPRAGDAGVSGGGEIAGPSSAWPSGGGSPRAARVVILPPFPAGAPAAASGPLPGCGHLVALWCRRPS